MSGAPGEQSGTVSAAGGPGEQSGTAGRPSRPPRNPIKIRDSGLEDWATIWPFFRKIVVAGETHCLPTAMMGADARAEWYAGPRTTVLVAVDTDRRDSVGYVGIGSSPIVGQVVGTVTIHPNQQGNGSHVAGASFMVDPQYAGRGIGRQLCLAALVRARAEGYRAMQFDAVVSTNAAAVALWTSLGFRIIGTVPGAFHHPREGYVGLHIMYREL